MSNGTTVWNRGVEYPHVQIWSSCLHLYPSKLPSMSKAFKNQHDTTISNTYIPYLYTWVETFLFSTLCPEFHSGRDISIAFHDHWNHAPVPVAKKGDDGVVLISLSADKRGLPFFISIQLMFYSVLSATFRLQTETFGMSFLRPCDGRRPKSLCARTRWTTCQQKDSDS